MFVLLVLSSRGGEKQNENHVPWLHMKEDSIQRRKVHLQRIHRMLRTISPYLLQTVGRHF